MGIKNHKIANPPYVFYAKVSDVDEHEFYFTGTANTVTEFKNKVKVYYATEIDEINAYKLRFNYVGNVGKIDEVNDGEYIEV